MTEYLNQQEVLESIESDGFHVADLGLLLSAIVRPSMSAFGEDAYPMIWLKAAAMLESLARNHALADGNKRIAMTLTDYFLALNGWDWLDTPANEDFVVGVAIGDIDVAGAATYLEEHSVLL